MSKEDEAKIVLEVLRGAQQSAAVIRKVDRQITEVSKKIADATN